LLPGKRFHKTIFVKLPLMLLTAFLPTLGATALAQAYAFSGSGSEPNVSRSWLGQRNSYSTRTQILPDPRSAIRRDHAEAYRKERVAWQKWRVAFENNHRAKLISEKATKLDSAEQRARWEFLSSQTQAPPPVEAGPGLSEHMASGIAIGRSMSADAVGTWIPSRDRPVQRNADKSILHQAADTIKDITRNVSQRTRDIAQGKDELVVRTARYGIPKQIAAVFALVMLHIPSAAIAFFAVGIMMIRAHNPRTGLLLLGVSALLAVIVFSALLR